MNQPPLTLHHDVHCLILQEVSAFYPQILQTAYSGILVR